MTHELQLAGALHKVVDPALKIVLLHTRTIQFQPELRHFFKIRDHQGMANLGKEAFKHPALDVAHSAVEIVVQGVPNNEPALV